MKMPHSDGLNIVPFIDVILVLLAIVLSLSTFIAQGEIKIALPKAQTEKLSSDSKSVELKIDKKGQLYLDNVLTNLEEISNYIQQLQRQEWIYLVGDKESPLDSFIQVIIILKRYQHENFKIITEQH
ncbi:TonB system transport protein ExbD [Helicobacter monodelphidis]|uniref:TonB system transport protein ExbD n=1 Tax=Helicobacter sp. 15-1451 TaxID=2004995 RepID=UPI000DCB8D7A|nr:TonB system transport protein ExbD [Helicobacter sp. 15-1451]RAX58431.1 TonB system transport protein ExbD [Helicobacter sp. 15-1451]